MWIGLVGVASPPESDFLEGAKGAYVNVVTLASDVTDYANRVKEALGELGLDLIEIEDSESLSRRMSKWTVDEEIMMMAKTARRTGSVTFGTFYAYEDEEESPEKLNAARR